MTDAALEIARMAVDPMFDVRTLGRIVMRQEGNLAIFNYTDKASFAPMATWNRYEKVCRGLIVNRKAGEIVARPFVKFWNYGEDLPDVDDELVSVSEKLDGSLVILHYTMVDGWRIWRMATRGAFHSEQADWATDFFSRTWGDYDLSEISDLNVTLLFEAIYPANRVVINYGGYEDLVLLGVMNIRTGHDYRDVWVDGLARRLGFSRPQRYDMRNIDEIMAASKALDVNHEGWVLRYASGKRLKVKGDAYRMMHKMLSEVSFRYTVEAIQAGRLAAVCEALPVDYARQMRQWGMEIENEVAGMQATVFANVEAWRVKGGSRKEFAIWVMTECKDKSQLYFLALDGEDIRGVILRRFAENKQARW